MSKQELIDKILIVLPSMPKDLIGIVYEYWIRCPITWKTVIGIQNPVPVTQEESRRLLFPGPTQLSGLRTHPFSDCSVDIFTIRLRIDSNCSSIRFQSKNIDASEGSSRNGVNFCNRMTLAENKFDGTCSKSDVFFYCVRRGDQLFVKPSRAFQGQKLRFTAETQKKRSFFITNNWFLEILFYNRFTLPKLSEAAV